MVDCSFKDFIGVEVDWIIGGSMTSMASSLWFVTRKASECRLHGLLNQIALEIGHL